MAKIKLKEDWEGPGKRSPSGVSQCQHARRRNQSSLVMLTCWCFKKKNLRNVISSFSEKYKYRPKKPIGDVSRTRLEDPGPHRLTPLGPTHRAWILGLRRTG